MVVPTTQEAEAGELLELGRHRLWLAKIAPLHFSLGTECDTVSKKKRILEDNIGKTLLDIGLGKDFMTKKTKANVVKTKINS